MTHKQAPHWMHVSTLKEVLPGEAKAIRLENGHSIALFNVEGRIYATDNQCPHMGYPLTRGAIRNGILTCDWHGRSFDLEGGGMLQQSVQQPSNVSRGSPAGRNLDPP